ncbi:ABC transporter permease [Elioraea sp.]|uniref:ABC transporter permease n=1 Tax=Elioraea sp. TaxID=2185103 RepID=UPI0025BA8AF7|nr:ABC transporter permease [Elioraea sp.]
MKGWDARALTGMGLVGIVLLAAAFGPLVLPFGADTPDFTATLSAPSLRHPLGTDDLGRDVLARIVAGAQVSLLVGVGSVAFALLFGSGLGLVAGYLGGWTDRIVMRCVDVLLAFPGILLALGITAALGASLVNVVVAIAAVNLPVFARVARAEAMVLRRREFVTAVRAQGFPEHRILIGTVLPNASPPILVQASLLLASSIITESVLSFLGLGVQPPTPTWGNMLRNAVGFLGIADWLAWFPGLAIFITVLGFNLLGDGLRDRLDPNN